MAAAPDLKPGFVEVTVFAGTEIVHVAMGSTRFLYTADQAKELVKKVTCYADYLLPVLTKLRELGKSAYNEHGYGNYPATHSAGQHLLLSTLR